MTVSLPDFCVTDLSFRPGVFSTKRYSTISGASNNRIYGNRPTGASLSVEYKVSPADAAFVVALYYQARGDYDAVILPASIWASVPEIEGEVPDYLIWHFDGEPEVTPILPTISTLRVGLKGILEV